MFISGDSFVPETEYILGLRNSLPPETSDAHHAPADRAGQGQGGGRGHGAHAAHDDPGGGHVMEPPQRIDSSATFLLSRDGVAESALIDEILYDRVKAISVDPSRESVLFLAHGPGDEAENERWLSTMRLRAQRIHTIGRFRHVQCETLREDWPERRALAEKRIRNYVEQAGADGGRCIVIPFRIADFGPYKEVLDGLTYAADGLAFCPHPNMTRWIEETAKKCFSGDERAPSNDPPAANADSP
jgi:hypothetical protein